MPHAAGKLSWADREFTGSGVALEPAPGSVAVARWNDGAIAIASRRIGKGQIIQLGSSFWRNGKVEAEFLERLLTELGVRRNADASDAAIWARKAPRSASARSSPAAAQSRPTPTCASAASSVSPTATGCVPRLIWLSIGSPATSKNGLQDWLLTYNSSDTEHTADVRLAVERQPDVVWDLLTRKPVEFTFAGGFIKIRGVRYGPQEIHLFAVQRAGLVDALPFWWSEKVRYWKRPPASTSAAVAAAKKRLASMNAEPTASTENIPFTRWRFQIDADAKSDWLQPAFDDRGWPQIDTGPWNLIEPSLAGRQGAGLYRKTFRVPDSWRGRRIILNLFDWDRPIIYDQGEIFINGTTVATYKAHGWSQSYAYDVTPLLQKGFNVLAVRVAGGKQFSGICGSIWLEPELYFAKETDLSGSWDVVKADYRTAQQMQLPGAPVGRYLARDVDVPANWSGKTVYLHVETDDQWLGCVVVNGRLIVSNAYIHPFSPRLEVNLTPYLKPGRNRLELWPFATIPSVNPERREETRMAVSHIRLGVLEAGEPR